MKTKKLLSCILILSVFFLPSFSFAATCSKEGYTIFFLNGVWNKDEKTVQNNKESLEGLFEKSFLEKNKISFDHLYNPSHIGGLGDLKDVLTQLSYEQSASYSNDLDLLNIRNQLAEKLQTQKFIIVSHSQGNLYANALVSSLGLDGKPFMKVYPVASPSSYSLGSLHSRHITSSNDKIIVGGVRDKLGRVILEPNVTLQGGDPSGHAFKETYLEKGGDIVVRDIQTLLTSLEADQNLSPTSSCISPQPVTLDKYLQKVKVAFFDFQANVVVSTASVAQDVGSSYASFVATKILHSVTSTLSLANTFGNFVLSSLVSGAEFTYQTGKVVTKEALYLLNLGLGVADSGPAAVILAQSPQPSENKASPESLPPENPPQEEAVTPAQKEEIVLPVKEESSALTTSTNETPTATTTPKEVSPTETSSHTQVTTPVPSYSGSGGVAASPAPTPARKEMRCSGDETLSFQREEGEKALTLSETLTCNTYTFPHGITLLPGESLTSQGSPYFLFGEGASFTLSGDNTVSLMGTTDKEIHFLPLISGEYGGGFIFTPNSASSTVSLSHVKISSFGKRFYGYGGVAPLLENDTTVKMSFRNVQISSSYGGASSTLSFRGETFISDSLFESSLSLMARSTLEKVTLKNVALGISLPLKSAPISLSKISFENVALPLEIHGSHPPLDFSSWTFRDTPKEVSLLSNYSAEGQEEFSYVWDNPGFLYRFESLYAYDKSSFLFKNAALVTSGSLLIEGGNVTLSSSTLLSVGERNYYREELSVKKGGIFSSYGSEVSSRIVASGSSTVLLSDSLFSDRAAYGVTLSESSFTTQNSLLGVTSMNLAGSSLILLDSTISHLEPIYLSKKEGSVTPSSAFLTRSSLVSLYAKDTAHPYDVFINGGCFSSDGFEESLTIYTPLISCDMETNTKHVYTDFGRVENNATFSILSGANVQIAPAGSVLVSSGSLHLLGTEEKPVTITPESYCVNFLIERGASLYAEYARLPECSSYGANYYEKEDVDGSSLIIRGEAFLKNTSTQGLVSLFSGSLSYENVLHKNAQFFLQGGDVVIRNSFFTDSEGWGDTSLANSSCGLSSLVFENNTVARNSLGCLFVPLPVVQDSIIPNENTPRVIQGGGEMAPSGG
jgi:hypothetical protein